MIEIDDVRAQFSTFNYDDTDSVADAYLHFIDLATAPRLTHGEQGHLIYCDKKLRETQSTEIASMVLGKTGLLPVYESALAQARDCLAC